MTFRQFLDVVELRTKLISISTFLSGSLYGYYHSRRWDWTLFLLTCSAVLCIDMGTTGFNSYFDFKNGTDRADRNLERDKVILHEGVRASSTRYVSITLFAAAALLGILISYKTSWILIPAGGVCMSIGYLYTGGPYPISRTPLGELFAGGFLGTILFCIAYFIQAGSIALEPVLVSLSSSALVASILTANNTCDLENDRSSGRRTLSVLLGKKAGEVILYTLGAGGFLWAVFMVLIGFLPKICLIPIGSALIVDIRIYRNMHRRGYRDRTKGFIMMNAAKSYLVFSLAFLLGLLLFLWG